MCMVRISSIILLFSIINDCFSTPLDDYVNTPDPMFSWKRLQTYPQATHTVYIVNMTSQKWFDDSFSSQSIWWHYLTITVPKNIRRRQTVFLFVTGGDNTDLMPTKNPMTNLAISTGSITATIRQIPNQPFRFWADSSNKSRDEDALIAWTWKIFLENNGTDPNVLLRFPMTKAVVRAMDTIQEFLQQQHIATPQEFVIGGASKRGWTTWTTAAVDNTRVVGAVPIVMDMVNLRSNMMSHYRSLGGWTFAFNDYYELNITLYLTSPLLDKMAQMIDPYSYFDRYKNTKILQIQAAGDEFFLPDSENFFWDELQVATGGSYLRRIPNTGHNIKGYDESLSSFYLSVSDRIPLPSWKWTKIINETHGVIRAILDFSSGKPKPTIVNGYHARTKDTVSRDFRQAKLNQTTGNIVANYIVWSNIEVIFEEQKGSTFIYSLTIPIPTDGYWIAAFIQAEFPGLEGTTLTLTTETLILPNTYAAEECANEKCYGQLV